VVRVVSEYSKTPEAARRRHRNQVQREIVSTERFYVIHLRFLERVRSTLLSLSWLTLTTRRL